MTYPVWICGITTGFSINTGNIDIISPRGSIGPQWIRDADPLDNSINGIYSEHKDLVPIFSKVIGCKFTNKSSANVNSHCWTNIRTDAYLTKNPNFVNLGLVSIHTSEKLGSVLIPTTIIITQTGYPNWIPDSHSIVEVAADRVIRIGSEQNYNDKTDFKTWRINQDFGRQNNSISQTHLNSSPIGTDITKGTTSPIDSITFGTTTPKPTPLT